MVPWGKVKAFPADLSLDLTGLKEVYKCGFSRVPVYRKHPHDIIGLCLTKDLIVVAPDPKIKLGEFVRRMPVVLSPETSMMEAMNIFQAKKTHFALITENVQVATECFRKGKTLPKDFKWIGAITLEDIMEELIQEEIEDEFDRGRQPGTLKKNTLSNWGEIELHLKRVLTPDDYVPAFVSHIQAKNDRKSRLQANRYAQKPQAASEIGINSFTDMRPRSSIPLPFKHHRDSIGTEPMQLLKSTADDVASSCVFEIEPSEVSINLPNAKYGAVDLKEPLFRSGSERYTTTQTNSK